MSDALERALREAPQHVFARRFAGETYLQAAAQLDSEGFLRQAERLLENDPRIDGERADLYARTGRPDEAAAIYRKLLEKEPDNRYIQRRLARVTE